MLCSLLAFAVLDQGLDPPFKSMRVWEAVNHWDFSRTLGQRYVLSSSSCQIARLFGSGLVSI